MRLAGSSWTSQDGDFFVDQSLRVLDLLYGRVHLGAGARRQVRHVRHVQQTRHDAERAVFPLATLLALRLDNPTAAEKEARADEWHGREEEHPEGQDGGDVGFRLRQRKTDHHHHKQAVVHGRLCRYRANLVAVLPRHQRRHRTDEIAEEGEEKRSAHCCVRSDLEHVQIDVHSERDEENAEEEQEGLHEPVEEGVGGAGAEVVQENAHHVGARRGAEPDLEVEDRLETRVGRTQKAAHGEDPQRGHNCKQITYTDCFRCFLQNCVACNRKFRLGHSFGERKICPACL